MYCRSKTVNTCPSYWDLIRRTSSVIGQTRVERVQLQGNTKRPLSVDQATEVASLPIQLDFRRRHSVMICAHTGIDAGGPLVPLQRLVHSSGRVLVFSSIIDVPGRKWTDDEQGRHYRANADQCHASWMVLKREDPGGCAAGAPQPS